MDKKRNSSSSSDNVCLPLKGTPVIGNNKRKILHDIKKDCYNKVKIYKKKYKKIKKIDDIIDMSCALMTGTSIALTISGFTIPPLLIASAVTSGASFCISRVQDKINFKSKYTKHNMTINQYNNLIREIITILTKNHLTPDEYHKYIIEVYDKISLIDDSALII